MSLNVRTRSQRIQVARDLAKIIEDRAANVELKEIAHGIQTVLCAPAELLSSAFLSRLNGLIHANSGDCCFRQRGYNWKLDQGIWSVKACTVCKKFTKWADALQAAMSDREFRELKPVAIAPKIAVPSAPVPYLTFRALQATRKQLDRLDAQKRIGY